VGTPTKWDRNQFLAPAARRPRNPMWSLILTGAVAQPRMSGHRTRLGGRASRFSAQSREQGLDPYTTLAGLGENEHGRGGRFPELGVGTPPESSQLVYPPWGMALTVVAVASSMFWFPAPATPDPRAAAFLAVERQYIDGPWTLGRIVLTALVPIWFVALAWAVRRRSWLGVATVIGSGTLLKVAWSFRAAGSSAWVIVPPVVLGTVVCAGVLLIAYTRVRRRPA